jgi:hypothetical protein
MRLFYHFGTIAIMPKIFVTLENLVIFLFAVYMYYVFGASWLLFAALFLTPDISMVGYLINSKIGAYMYNAIHNYALAATLLIIAALLKLDLLAQLSFILTAHIALDRLFGFGLKYPTDFKHTHHQRL